MRLLVLNSRNFCRECHHQIPNFAELLANREAQAQTIAGLRYADGPTYQEQYLDELAADGALEELIDTATRYSESSDQTVSISARRHLAGGLLRSGDEERRRQGQMLAFPGILMSLGLMLVIVVWLGRPPNRLAIMKVQSTLRSELWRAGPRTSKSATTAGRWLSEQAVTGSDFA